MYKVFIRPLCVEDALTSYQWRNDPEVWKYTGSKPDKEITLDIEHNWIKRVIVEEDSERFAIIADDIYVGNIQLTNIDTISAEYHIFIGDKSWWGKGIAHLATFQLLFYAKEQLNLNHIYLSVREDNQAAVKSYLKTSFVIESSDDGWLKMTCNVNKLPPPTVSVFVMVYNHEKYLKKCLDGILMQKCTFNFTVVVGEDYSTDSSRTILLEYNKKYPGKFRLLLHKQNIGAFKNQNSVLNACNGKYIAMCEGDDYWTDPIKLQEQVNFLEKNKDYILCFTNRDILKSNKLICSPALFDKQTFTKSEIPNIHVPTLTVLFRNIVDKIPVQMQKSLIDASLFLFLSQFGSFYYLYQKSAVYRVHAEGMWNGNSNIKNYTRSVNVRLASWKHFPNIDKLAVAHALVNWIKLKKMEERNHKMHWSALRSEFQEFYFTTYIRFNKLLSKNNSLD